MYTELLAAAALSSAAAAALKHVVFKPISHVLTGEQRRRHCPLEKPIAATAQVALEDKSVRVERKLHQMPCGKKVFCQVVRPVDAEPTHMLVLLHGYTSSSEFYLEVACTLARQGALVLLPDMPGHGRTDGELCYVSDWWGFIHETWAILDFLVPLVRPAKTGMKIFGAGSSMGGGIITCLAMTRPMYFDGVIPLCPMLFVSDDIKPHWIVQLLFKYVIRHTLPTWPVAPTKPMAHVDYRVPEQGISITNKNLLGMQHKPPRLGTAYELAFRWPEWVDKNIKELKTPFLVLHGEADQITDPKLSQRLYDEAGSKDKSIKLYPGVFHGELLTCTPGFAKTIELDFKPEQLEATETTLRDMAAWIKKRL
eukprot:TRINITY_DN21372_c0_g1_i1.p1 TRINITY_DN21372_c0_g1~~TRINITY_DN21372_c0_g1_i1.p1  ORF type:complete len:367 (-),score=91.80 TRINITY_DN21372_c0_g1_i1:251-1351(-)